MTRRGKNLWHLFNALLANLFYGFPSKKLTVIGVTGTDGKTTTASLIYHILKIAGKKAALITSVSARIGKKDIPTGFHVTTPNSWPLQKLIKQIADKNYQYLVLEATSHGLDQHRLSGISFHLGVLTNITHEHLDYHQTFDKYLRAKAKLFQHSHHAILNQDDESFYPLKVILPQSTLLHTYSLKSANKSLLSCIKSRFPEKYNWSNSLAAVTVAHLLQINSQIICQAIKSFPGVRGRMELVPNKKNIIAIVDFAHTPNALKNALQAIHNSKFMIHNSRIIAVFGSAGLRDKAKRPLMGKIGSQLADIVILTAEDPRTEAVDQIINQIKQGAAGKAKIFIEPDRQTAINLAIVKLARQGDIVAVFGKGHEQSMCFGKIEYPWSDDEAIKAALKKRK